MVKRFTCNKLIAVQARFEVKKNIKLKTKNKVIFIDSNVDRYWDIDVIKKIKFITCKLYNSEENKI